MRRCCSQASTAALLGLRRKVLLSGSTPLAVIRPTKLAVPVVLEMMAVVWLTGVEKNASPIAVPKSVELANASRGSQSVTSEASTLLLYGSVPDSAA